MADSDFEEFRRRFEKLPQRTKVPAPFYSLVPDLIDHENDSDSPTSCKSDNDTDCDIAFEELNSLENIKLSSGDTVYTATVANTENELDSGHFSMEKPDELDEAAEGPRFFALSYVKGSSQPYTVLRPTSTEPCTTTLSPAMQQTQLQHTVTVQQPHNWISTATGETRPRRRLPEIPKIKRVVSLGTYLTQETAIASTLASELASTNLGVFKRRNVRCDYSGCLDDTSVDSPDSERYNLPHFWNADVDSGHSTAHSPTDGLKSLTPPFINDMTASTTSIKSLDYQMLQATHRSLHKFIPRHRDELELEIGDPIYVQKEADDLWCEGVNLRSGCVGIFPSAYVVDSEYSEFDPSSCEEQVRRERYLLGYMGSVETITHKGTAVVCQATKRVLKCEAHPCILEVSDRGIRMVDRSKPRNDQPCIDYFYSLKNVSFCAFHPRDHRYLGFITKHPTLQRFACHIFKGNESTRPVAESVGRAFQRFYQKFIDTAYPIEDIYIE